MEFVFAIENRAYEDIVEQITGQQMSCLRALAAQGGKAGISGEFVAETGITLSTSVRKAMNRLVDKADYFHFTATTSTDHGVIDSDSSRLIRM